jgi:hypothetical protein
MHKVGGNYNSCTGRSSENICSSGGGNHEKGNRGSKQDETQLTTKNGAFLSFTPQGLEGCMAGFFYSHFVWDQTQGSGAVFS